MDLIEEIGPFAGLAAFAGLAVLAFLLFQQSRDLRRLREWAGRAPERAQEAAEASLAAAEARGEETPAVEGPSAIAQAWDGVREWAGTRWESFDRRLPVDGRILLGVVGAMVIAAAVLSSGFGLADGGDGGDGAPARAAAEPEGQPQVAVLNATQTDTVQGVSGLADKVATEVVKQLGYPLGVRTDAPRGFGESVVMFGPRAEGDAAQLARAISRQLGDTEIQEMTEDVKGAAGGAPLVLLIGADDDDF